MRRRDPERIYQAQRAGIFARLTQNERIDELDAEHWGQLMGAAKPRIAARRRGLRIDD